MKIHVGVDRESRTVHSLVTTPANVHDSKMVEDLLHGEENAVFGDSAYMGKTEDITKKAPGALDLTQTRGSKNRKLTEEEKETNPPALENKKPGRAHLPHREKDLRLFEGQLQGAGEPVHDPKKTVTACRGVVFPKTGKRP